MNLSIILEVITAIGVIFFAIGQFSNGRTVKKDAGLEAALNTIQALKENLITLTESQKEDHDTINQLKGQLEAKDKELASLRATILNPGLNLGQLLMEVKKSLDALNSKQDHQTSLIEGQVQKEKIIAERDINLEPGRSS